MTPLAFAKDFIVTWEDGGSVDPAKTHSLTHDDPGNWSTGIIDKGNLIGSNHGVTPAALAVHRLVPVAAITYDVMHVLTVDEAADMALSMYYHAPGLDRFPWDAVIASVFDFGWGAGPVQSIKLLQRAIGVADDGQIGPRTVTAYQQWIASHGLEACARLWQNMRDSYYRLITTKRPVLAKFLSGWMRRSAYFAPGGPWWKRFNKQESKAA